MNKILLYYMNRIKKNKILINILTRTGSRPKYFKRCYDSIIAQSYKNYRHIISNDNPDCKYLDNLDDVYFIDKSNIKNIRNFYNLYLDTLASKCKDGWIIIIDDDDKFIDKNFLSNLAKKLENCNTKDVLIYQSKIDKKIFPSNDDMINNYIRYWGIGMPCFCVHYTLFKDITFESCFSEKDGYKCGDYKIISKIQKSGNYNLKFVDIPIGISANYDGQRLGK